MDTRQIKIFIFILSVLAVNSARKDGMAPTPDQLQSLNEFSEINMIMSRYYTLEDKKAELDRDN